jgi:hypothetical protein
MRKIEKQTPFLIVSNKMKVFIVYDSSGFVWERAYTSLQSVIDVVSVYVEQENLRAKEIDNSLMKMQTEFTYKYLEGCVLVAHNPDSSFCIFFKELIL